MVAAAGLPVPGWPRLVATSRGNCRPSVAANRRSVSACCGDSARFTVSPVTVKSRRSEYVVAEDEEDEASDLLAAMEEIVGQRHFGFAVRLEVDDGIPVHITR